MTIADARSIAIRKLFARRVVFGAIVLMLTGCTPSSYERGDNPQGPSQRDVENTPFPFSGGPQSSADHARALHGLSTIGAMRDTCLAAPSFPSIAALPSGVIDQRAA
jgi:hypothetical protein